ncbi:MAG: hypothetical protein ACFFDO_07615 [Candidatus Thorarchaeota archaeon]
MVNVEIRCPECSKIGKLEVEENLIIQSKRGVSAINVAEDLICNHSFIAYIDKNLNVRDCFITDFTIELPQIEVEQITEDKIPGKDTIDVYLLTLNLNALSLTNILRACFFKKKILLLNDFSILNPHIMNFFKFIFQDTFDIDISIEQEKNYKKDKKKYKAYIVISKDKIFKDKEKILSKLTKIERIIVQKFLAEQDPQTSLIILKNEISKAYKLSKDVELYLKDYDKTSELTPKLISNFLTEKYNQKISDLYLRFLIKIVQYYSEVDFSKIFDFDNYIRWNWFLK